MTARQRVAGHEGDFVGAAGNIHRYRDGIIRIGIPFAILNLAIVCAICVSFAGISYTSWTASNLAEMPAGQSAPDLARSNLMLFWGILLVLIVLPVLSLIATTLAGILSGSVNAVKDEKEAKANGRIIGITMWAVVMLAGLGLFCVLIVGSINYLSHNVNGMALPFLFIIALIPVALIYWVFTYFSRLGSLLFLRFNEGRGISISGVLEIVKKSFGKGERSWIAMAIGALVVTWTVLLFYGMFAFIISMH